MARSELRFFGPLTDLVGVDQEGFDYSAPTTAAELRAAILAAYPQLRDEQFRIAVDARLVGERDTVHSAREIALLPAFAGG